MILFHGFGDSATNWVGYGVLGPNFPLQLVDNGYDVWMSSDRGQGYSNRNIKDGSWSLTERWDYNFIEQARSDNPAIIDRVLKETGKPKATVFGYSMGSA